MQGQKKSQTCPIPSRAISESRKRRQLAENERRARGALYGKDVCLLGGMSELDSEVSSLLNRYDFFVHLNHHLLRRPALPCDWWICRSEVPVGIEDLEHLEKAPAILSTSVDGRKFEEFRNYALRRTVALIPFHEKHFARMNPFHFSLEWCNSFRNQLNTNPLLGVLALRMILSYPVRSVTLRGFDFYSSIKSNLEKVGSHDLVPQKKWLIRTWQSDFRVHLDETLIQALGLDPKSRGISKTYSSGAGDLSIEAPKRELLPDFDLTSLVPDSICPRCSGEGTMGFDKSSQRKIFRCSACGWGLRLKSSKE